LACCLSGGSIPLGVVPFQANDDHGEELSQSKIKLLGFSNQASRRQTGYAMLCDGYHSRLPRNAADCGRDERPPIALKCNRRKAMTNLNVEILELTIDELQEVSGGAKIDPRGYGPASAYRFAQGAPADIQWALDGLPPRPV
jgi:hypothetical protein